MNQKDLISKIAAINGESKSHIEALLKTAADVIAAELAEGGEVTLPGLGKLSVKARPAQPAKAATRPPARKWIFPPKPYRISARPRR